MRFGFVCICEGDLVATIDDDEVFRAPADAESAAQLGAEMEETTDVEWFYSSLIDFPDEYGAPAINFRAALAAGAGVAKEDMFDPINFGGAP